MSAIASQITSLTIDYSIVYSDADQRKHQSAASLAFVWGIHRGPVNSPHKWPVTRKMFPFDDVIMFSQKCSRKTPTGVNLGCIVWVHDDVINWRYFPSHWPFVRGIHRWPVDSLHKGQWHGVFMFSLMCPWTNSWANNRDAVEFETLWCSLWRHCNVMVSPMFNRIVSNATVLFNLLWPSITPYSIIDVGQHRPRLLACCLTAPSHNLNQRRRINSAVQWLSPGDNFTRDTTLISY